MVFATRLQLLAVRHAAVWPGLLRCRVGLFEGGWGRLASAGASHQPRCTGAVSGCVSILIDVVLTPGVSCWLYKMLPSGLHRCSGWAFLRAAGGGLQALAISQDAQVQYLFTYLFNKMVSGCVLVTFVAEIVFRLSPGQDVQAMLEW